MRRRSMIGRSFITMLKDRGGNFGMMTAVAAPLLLAAGGVSIDMANMLMTKNQLQDATDAAALAAASALVSDEQPDIAAAKEIARKFLKTQAGGTTTPDAPADSGDGASSGAASSTPTWDDVNTLEVNITETPNGTKGKIFQVTVINKHVIEFNAMTRLLGTDSIELEASSTAESATESKNALSMYLVLDRSGSMAWKTNTINTAKKSCPNYTESNWSRYPNLWASSPCYVTKIDALKTAVTDLLAQLLVADPDQIYVRTAAISYNSVQDTAGTLAWGTSGAAAYVNALVATGGTASAGAFKTAYQKVIAETEKTAHAAKNGQVPSRYMVFMTDGENNYANDDTVTKQWCDTAKANKVEIYSVAFMAPPRGQALLKYCASSTSHYFEAEEVTDLVAAFKAIGERAAAVVSRLTK
ncbi:vWA domain-containing protein [Sinorhizobium fredii]|uniref:VWA domain-containing protein n=1 Tax=Rhizobium fredii TaxID=380 RepID=A0A2A6LYW3_RHIFR|nr:TadE/TadG family type IV pilus assembly protein [Sinorhizobium fredii]KSV90614.1 von Willebrand factor type A [Sinorhizobium fredii USDA 205]MCG5476050.1 VWA domain-containing protein [Sinorhizobium fredii]MQW96088.1 VWA domain-containing protein [Sinorhizobium fredii]MQX11865.1 VWA domain-containing protein [Sinorhizobium fredii]PDT47823.1 VWA domain-containing protein [Sinorhizobium fredii]